MLQNGVGWMTKRSSGPTRSGRPMLSSDIGPPRSGSVRTSTSIPDIPGSEPERKTSVVPPVPPVVPVGPAVAPAVTPVVPVGPRGQLEGVGGGVGNGLSRLDLLTNLRDPLTDRWPADRRRRTAWRGMGGENGECRGGDDDAPDTRFHKSVEMAEELPAIGRCTGVHCVVCPLVGGPGSDRLRLTKLEASECDVKRAVFLRISLIFAWLLNKARAISKNRAQVVDS